MKFKTEVKPWNGGSIHSSSGYEAIVKLLDDDGNVVEERRRSIISFAFVARRWCRECVKNWKAEEVKQ